MVLATKTDVCGKDGAAVLAATRHFNDAGHSIWGAKYLVGVRSEAKGRSVDSSKKEREN